MQREEKGPATFEKVMHNVANKLAHDVLDSCPFTSRRAVRPLLVLKVYIYTGYYDAITH